MHIKALFPAVAASNKKDFTLGVLGAFFGLFVTEWACQYLLGTSPHWLIAPMGASAVLLFAAPASPLAQPWSMLIGNLLSAFVGVCCAKLIGNIALASALAVSIAIALMLLTRSLHPPGGAVALTAVIGGPTISSLGFEYVLVPVAINSIVLLLLAIGYGQLSGKRYPNFAASTSTHRTRDPEPSQRLQLDASDVTFALAQHPHLLDISQQDLQKVLRDAQLHALKQQIETVRCRDIMSQDVITVSAQDTGAVAWEKLSTHRIKALPVIDAQSALLGIITLHDLMIDPLTGQPRAASTAQRLVSELMTTAVTTAQPEQSILDLVPLFSDGGLHHLPIVDQSGLVGIITQSDMVAALFQWAIRAQHTHAETRTKI
ncbi:HPP family protein [Chitinibacter tainanensis]|uniref:HPP family protein n=1 Tax=Chitinibacter tainanensis TaxID=230667 RepID=UPI00042A7A0D|nr:HPP family protein [Chitinibacter tainanensis]